MTALTNPNGGTVTVTNSAGNAKDKFEVEVDNETEFDMAAADSQCVGRIYSRDIKTPSYLGKTLVYQENNPSFYVGSKAKVVY